MKRPLFVIFATIALDAIGIGLIFPILPRLLEDVTHASNIAPYIGGMIALYAGMQFLFAPMLGALSDRLGRRPVLLISLTGAAINYVVMAFAPQLWMLLVGRAIAGLTSANVAVAMAYITDISPEDTRARRFGLFNAMFAIGFIIDPVLGGLLGDYGRRADKQRIAEWFHTHNTDVFNDEYYEINSTRLAPSYNIAPESIQPIVRFDRDTGERVLALMKWGLVPYWSKTPKASFSSINARSDKLESSGAWREPWKHRRCLIPANFFFEWEPLTKEEEKRKLSKPWAVSLADDGLFAFGGIWDRWKGLDEKKSEIVVESFSIITTDPNEVLEPFHNRCPLIIEPKDYERWLAPAEPSHLPIDLVRAYPAEEMKAWRVAKLQGNGPHLLEPLTDSSESARSFIAEQ